MSILFLILFSIAKAGMLIAPPPGGTGSGSVTSVAMTVPSWLSVTGSPITSSGTLALSFSNLIDFTKIATPSNPAANHFKAFVDSTEDKFRILNSSGSYASFFTPFLDTGSGGSVRTTSITDIDNTSSIEFDTGGLYDGDAIISVQWLNRSLHQSGDGVLSLNWDGRSLWDHTGSQSMGWGQNQRWLYNNSEGGVLSFNDYVYWYPTQTNDNAPTNYNGEYISASVAQGSAVSLSTATPKTVTSIALKGGDWDVNAMVCLTGTLTGTQFIGAIGQTTNSLTGTTLGDSQIATPSVSSANSDECVSIPGLRKSLSGNTTVYLIAQSTFTVGTAGAYGRLSARRAR